MVCRPHNYNNREVFNVKEKDISSLNHTTWRCQYHIVFAPKYRRMSIYGEIKVDIGKILRQLCQQKGIEIIEAELCLDHVHMLISISNKIAIIQFDFLLRPPSLATNNVKPKHMRKEPVAISTLYNKAKYPVCKVINVINAKTIVLKVFISNLLYVRKFFETKKRQYRAKRSVLPQTKAI